ncbi:ABC transporter permease [Bradyrhizobium sp. CCGUVB1N3]|uniref:ABC transporter permease n=1 Tax=Bradyrhizobium sp. CCGUVB1N3 TaxID=2949629 RepID=UPI0020B24907|nr:ABC transporter permease [Bradyrhizobium sp. CCGUVB1N3]MCP3476211.1 ABC transporter permease [Bradyrhizobium sp. CCGUVB1N3]
MMLRTHLAGAMSALRASSLRSLLTMGGLAVGVASLIGLAGIGDGFTSAVSDEMAALGTHLLVVEPRSPAQDRRADRKLPGTLIADDARVIAAIPGVANAAPIVLGALVALGPSGNGSLSLIGSESSFAQALHLKAASGRLLLAADEREAAKNVVLGARIARVLLGAEAVELVARDRAEITIGKALFHVIAVLEPVGSVAGWNIDESGLMPFATARLRLLGADHQTPLRVDALLIDLVDPAAKTAITADARAALRERHRIVARDSSDFAVVDLAASARAEDAILRTVRLFLLVTAVATILVGGVGIANIMLVAVAERRGEIGLLQALGARRQDILLQFLLEATILAVCGGLCGAGLGVGGGQLAAVMMGLRFHVAVGFVAAAVAGAGMVGVASGLFPARQASRLSPLTALRGPG